MEKTYSAPEIVELGSVSELTLGLSTGKILDQNFQVKGKPPLVS